MTDRKIFDLFYGAREEDIDLCHRAYENGADINTTFDGRKAKKGGAGRWYYGDLQWYAPDGIDGDKKDTLLIIAVKVNNSKLIEWVLGLDGLDPMKKNGKGMTAMAVAKALGRENLLLGIAETESGETETSSGVKSMAVGALPPPPGTAVGGAELEIARLSQAVKMLKAASEEKDAEIATAEINCRAYQQIIKEKDATIGELQKSVFEKEKEVIVMLHKIGRLEEHLREFTDFRLADAEQFTDWGKAGQYNAESDARDPETESGS